MAHRTKGSLHADLARRFLDAQLALASAARGALDELAAIAIQALGDANAPLAAASAGVIVLAEHVQWRRHRHAPRMVGVLAAVGPDAAAAGDDGLLAWAGAAVAHDYGVLPSWPRADMDLLIERARQAPTNVALALGCALVEVCRDHRLDADFAALQALMAGVDLRSGAAPFWRGYASIACSWYLYSFGQRAEELQCLETAQALAAAHCLTSLGAVAGCSVRA